ncbi:hypothetical protein IMZ48_30270 [Candidatus Bathyarchaeota archaeon]|nr:hypothetical protein [Candidatus Bathyarchaeota archaeon]
MPDTEGGYHGYWAKDLKGINENYGTAEDLKSFVSAAHAAVRTPPLTTQLPKQNHNSNPPRTCTSWSTW